VSDEVWVLGGYGLCDLDYGILPSSGWQSVKRGQASVGM